MSHPKRALGRPSQLCGSALSIKGKNSTTFPTPYNLSSFQATHVVCIPIPFAKSPSFAIFLDKNKNPLNLKGNCTV